MNATVTQLHQAPAAAPRTRKKVRRQFGNTRKLPSGRWQARYTGPDEILRSAPVTFDTKADASAWLAKKQTEMTDQTWRPPVAKTRQTLAAFTDGWVETHRTKTGKPLAPKTQEDYQRWLDRLILPVLGDRRLDLISPEVVAAWHRDLCPKAPTQRARVYSLLQTILGEALPVNPCQVEGAGTAKTRKKIRPATLGELKTLIEALPDRYRAAVLLAGWCTLRYGELTELRRGDVDLKAQTFTVARAVTWVRRCPEHLVCRCPEGRYVPVVGGPKSEAGVREVAIPPHILTSLEHHLKTYVGASRDSLLFPARQGGHLRSSSFEKVFTRAKGLAGRPDLTPHQLRHTGATLAAHAGATLQELMAQLGHSSPGMALRYQHVAEGRPALLAARLSAMSEELSTTE
jgi:integrase